MGVAPVAVWLTPDIVTLDHRQIREAKTSPRLPRVFGATGFGPAVVEVAELRWSDVCLGTLFHIRITGEPGADRSAIVAKFVSAYRVKHPGAEALFSDGSVESIGELFALFRSVEKETERGVRSAYRLVVIEVDGTGSTGGTVALFADALTTRGALVRWSLLLVRPPTSPSVPLPWRKNTAEVFALSGVEPSPESGAGIAAALRSGMRTPAGVEAMAGGAPAEWARAFESGVRA